jgi:hypothetical protein
MPLDQALNSIIINAGSESTRKNGVGLELQGATKCISILSEEFEEGSILL